MIAAAAAAADYLVDSDVTVCCRSVDGYVDQAYYIHPAMPAYPDMTAYSGALYDAAYTVPIPVATNPSPYSYSRAAPYVSEEASEESFADTASR